MVIALTNGQLAALGAAGALAGSVMEFSAEDAAAAKWIRDTHLAAFGRSYEVRSETARACEVDDVTATNLVRFVRKAYRVALSHHMPETVLEVLYTGRVCIEAAAAPSDPGSRGDVHARYQPVRDGAGQVHMVDLWSRSESVSEIESMELVTVCRGATVTIGGDCPSRVTCPMCCRIVRQ